MTTSLKQQKLDYLKRAVESLKKGGLTQRAIAEKMNEDEGSLSAKLAGKRGITDEYIDAFAAEFKKPFGLDESGGVTAEQIERLVKNGETANAVLLRLVEKIEAMDAEIRTLKQGQTP